MHEYFVLTTTHLTGNENNTVEKGNLGGKEQLERKGVKEEKASDDVVPDKEPLPHANSL